MAADVPEVALAKLPKQVDWVAPRVAGGIPCGKLATVCADADGHDTAIYGLVKRQQVLQEEGDWLDGFTTNIWLLRLVRGSGGSYHWEDFIPVCKHCKERMRPIMSRQEQPACPVCKGRKGRGKCFQFDCPQYSEASAGCGQLEAASRPVYCGSHPYFGGYEVTDEYFSNSSHPLFHYEVSSYEDCDNFSLVADQVCDGLQVDVFRGLFEETSLRVRVEEGKQSIISATEVRKCAGSSPISSAILVSWNREHVDSKCIHYMYILVQRYGHKSCILRSVETKPNKWLDWATIEADDQCTDFRKQLVVIRKNCFESTRIAGLSHDSLWVMDVPQANLAEGPKTASSMASKLSWKRVLKFTDVRELEDEDGDFPDRLLAPGPKPNQVVIFAADETNQGVIRPRLLVEIPASLTEKAAEVTTVQLTSIVNVPVKSRDVSERPLSSDLLPSIVRITGQSGGYLLFNKLGQVYHLRDEAIILAKTAWKVPDFKRGSIKHQVVAFKVKDVEQRTDIRLCAVSMLERYEYFQKLLGQWQEGASAEVNVTDISLDVFDHFLTYIHTGTVDCQLELVALVRLITLANKYLMDDLVASCLLHILSILQDPERMSRQETSALAEMLAFSDNASMCCPTMMKKLIDAVLSHRGDVIKDQEFLKQLSNSSARALSLLLAPLAPPRHHDMGRFGMRKRQKVVREMQRSLWHGEHEASEAPRWCSSV